LSSGNTVCEEILKPGSQGQQVDWGQLLSVFNFFDSFKHYLQVEVVATSKDDFELWEGWVHSRMRLLVRSAGVMVDIRPWPKALRPPSTSGDTESLRCFYFMGLSKKRAQSSYQYGQPLIIPQSKVDLTPAVNEFAHKVKDWPERRAGMDIFVKHVLKKQLPEWVRAGKITKESSTVDGVERVKRALDNENGGNSSSPVLHPPTKRVATGDKGVYEDKNSVMAAVERRDDLVDWTAPGEAGGHGDDATMQPKNVQSNLIATSTT